MKKTEIAQAIRWLETFDEKRARAEHDEMVGMKSGQDWKVKQAREDIIQYKNKIQGAEILLRSFGYNINATFYQDGELIRRRYNIKEA